LGVKVDIPSSLTEEAINTIGIGFMFAPLYHPAMKYVMPARKELKVRTVFNILGPITNPARAEGRVLGVFSESLLDHLAEVLLHTGVKRAFVLHGADGLDEISLCAPTSVVEVRDGRIWKYCLNPEDYGFDLAAPEALAGEGPIENAKMILDILSGMPGPRRNVVLLNAAAAIVAGGGAEDLKKGLVLAANSIDSGAAMRKLEELKIITNRKEG
jgi:anthranilate phosphoribosyltransferase